MSTRARANWVASSPTRRWLACRRWLKPDAIMREICIWWHFHCKLVSRSSVRWMFRSLATVTVLTCIVVACSCSQSRGNLPRRSIDRRIGTVVVSHERVLLLPTITGGEGGWCVTLRSGECPTAGSRAVRAPIVIEHWSGHSPPPVNEGFVLTTNEVAAVSIDGATAIPTHAESVLPDHLRAAVVELEGGAVRHVRGSHLTLPPRPPRFTPLDSNGNPIPQTPEAGVPLMFVVPGRGWTRQANAPQGVCEMQSEHLGGLVFQGGFVASQVEPHIGLLGRPFVSCVSESYLFEGWPLVASVLLDAAHPGSTVAGLPGMKPLLGHPGFFQGPVAEGEAVARRIPGAWLVVARGRGNAQRLRVLKHLHATIHL